MFAIQNQYDMLPDESARKRAWEGDGGLEGFAEHRNKRHNGLPLHNGSQASESIAPLNSQVESLVSNLHGPTAETNNSVLVSDASSQPSSSRLAAIAAENRSHAGRIPTPIQPSFAAQIRGHHAEWATTNAGSQGLVNMGHHQYGYTGEQANNSNSGCDMDWQDLQNNRRLPSPISEGGDSGIGQDMHSPGMVMHEEDSDQSQLSARLRNSSISSQTSPVHLMEHPNAMMDIETPSSMQHQEGGGDPESPSPNRRGHMRSKHTINSWTWQPGMQRSFSIGYRADCEKCRLKVPGHFNHIIIS